MSFVSSKGNILCRLIKIELYKIFAIINRAIKGLHCISWTLRNKFRAISIKIHKLHSGKCIRKCCLQNVNHFVQDSMYWVKIFQYLLSDRSMRAAGTPNATGKQSPPKHWTCAVKGENKPSVRYKYTTVNILQNTHNRHPIACLPGKLWGVYCGFKVWSLFDVSHYIAVFSIVNFF